MNRSYTNITSAGNSCKFDIRDYVEFDHNGRAVCPNCGDTSKGNKKNLSVVIGGERDGQYKCFKCDDIEAIREALGQPKTQIIPTSLARSPQKKPKVLVSEETVIQNSTHLLTVNSSHGFKALAWLKERGILPEIVKRYKLGLVRAKFEDKFPWAISIPIPYEGQYFQKKRLIPWEKDHPSQAQRPWSQFGIPKLVYFTHLPEEAEETWLCEGEWDAILLGWLVQHSQPQKIAVAAFTCGCKSIPPQTELDKLPGQIKIFYDRNDKPVKGKRAGDEGAKKLAQALGERAKIAQVPMAEDCAINGWDVSDAINAGYRFADFELAASQARSFRPDNQKINKFSAGLVSARTILDRAPDYVEELWSSFFSCNEMYLLAAPPRLGKSLFTLALAKAVATGTEFLGRPTKKGKVVLVSKEDPEDKLKERMIAQNWGDEEFENINFQQDFTLDDLPDLIDYMEQEKPALLVLDTFSRIRTDNISENDSNLSKVLSPLQDAAQQHNVCVVVVHHTTKGGLIKESTEEIFDKVRGTGSLRGVCRGMVVLTKGKDCVRLVAENGRNAVQDLKISLDPSNLIWKDLGKWKPPNVDNSQRNKVLEWLIKNQSGQVTEISKSLDVHPKTTHKILTRLVAEKLVKKEGRRRKTIYYIASDKSNSTQNEAVEAQSPRSDFDQDSFSSKYKKSNNDLESERIGKELLQPPLTFSDNPGKDNSVESEKKKDESFTANGNSTSDSYSSERDLSNNYLAKVINANRSVVTKNDHFENTTKNFCDKVTTESEDNPVSNKEDESKESKTKNGNGARSNSGEKTSDIDPQQLDLNSVSSTFKVGDRVKGCKPQAATSQWQGRIVEIDDLNNVSVQWEGRKDLMVLPQDSLVLIE